ncbi:MAG: histidinol-phosphatase HisJ family protein [Ruminococcaceae bacterium]|nr:histidinol-phosphatase HisJ family protein [Oscillospiraceae bacterium]
MINYPYNLHSHTFFGDGKNTPEEMAAAAFSKGFKTYGFSEHSVLPWYESWCMTPYGQDEYIKKVNRLKKEYEGKMEIALGIEMDLNSDYTEKQLNQFDYIISSVHSVTSPDGKICYADASENKMVEGIEIMGGANIFAEKYFENVVRASRREKADILGHFDLVLKYNQSAKFIDENAKWYRDLALSAAGEVAKSGIIVEVNTGAISRKARSIPYPTKEIIGYMNEKGVRFILSSDTHATDTLDCFFDGSIELLKSCNVKTLVTYENGQFGEMKI